MNEFSLSECVSDAWAKVNGVKGTIFVALLIVTAINILFAIISGFVGNIAPIIGSIFTFAGNFIGFLLSAGIAYIGIQRAKGMPVNYKMTFFGFENKMGKRLISIYVLQSFILLVSAVAIFLVPYLLLGLIDVIFGANLNAEITHRSTGLTQLLAALWIVFGIFGLLYVMVAMLLSSAFALDQALKPIECFKRSYAVSKEHIMSLLFLVLIQIAALVLSTLTLGIFLIWAMPFVCIAYGEAYLQLSGLKVKQQ